MHRFVGLGKFVQIFWSLITYYKTTYYIFAVIFPVLAYGMFIQAKLCNLRDFFQHLWAIHYIFSADYFSVCRNIGAY